jgi:hypothetical protein
MKTSILQVVSSRDVRNNLSYTCYPLCILLQGLTTKPPNDVDSLARKCPLVPLSSAASNYLLARRTLELVLVTEDAVRSVHDIHDRDTRQETSDINDVIERHGRGVSSIVFRTCIRGAALSSGGLPLGPQAIQIDVMKKENGICVKCESRVTRYEAPARKPYHMDQCKL